MKRQYGFQDNVTEYKRRKIDLKVHEKSYEDLKNVFDQQHRKLQVRKQKYQSTAESFESCKTETFSSEEKMYKKLRSLKRDAVKAELKYRMTLSSAENKFALLQTAYVMYERSLMEFQEFERANLQKWSMDDNHNVRLGPWTDKPQT